MLSANRLRTRSGSEGGRRSRYGSLDTVEGDVGYCRVQKRSIGYVRLER